MRTLISLALLAPSLLVACAARTSITDAELAIDSSESTEAEGNTMAAAVDGAEVVGLVAPTAESVAARIAANAGTRYSPAGCVTATAQGATAKLVLNGCTGPRGLRTVTGELDLTASIDPSGAIKVHGAADNFEVNGAMLTISSDATYTVTPTGKQLAVITHGAGVGPRGNDVSHDGNYTIAWDASCHTLDGVWATTINLQERSTQASVHRCAGGCPTGTVTHTLLRGATISITFDGTATAQWSSSLGKSGTFALGCK
jgi:hypothetical protein